MGKSSESGENSKVTAWELEHWINGRTRCPLPHTYPPSTTNFRPTSPTVPLLMWKPASVVQLLRTETCYNRFLTPHGAKGPFTCAAMWSNTNRGRFRAIARPRLTPPSLEHTPPLPNTWPVLDAAFATEAAGSSSAKMYDSAKASFSKNVFFMCGE